VRSISACLVLVALVAAPSLAQCPAPDALDGGPCWGPASARLPEFPPIEIESREICWANCGFDASFPVLARWGRLRPAEKGAIPPLCSVLVSRLELLDTSTGALKWTGPIRCFYSRTWLESDPDGRALQVFRFLTNGDLLVRPAAGDAPCAVPPCAAAFGGRVHFSGHLDVALDCASGQRFAAWSLDHDCDPLHHAAGFNRAGAFHPDRSYTFVGPAAGFVPSPLLPPESGTTLLEAVRPLDLVTKVLARPPRGDVCVFEEPLDSASIEPFARFCPCGAAPGAQQTTLSIFRVSSACGTSIAGNVDAFPPGLASKSIGSWTALLTFPGLEELRITRGAAIVSETCRPRVNERHVFIGVSTTGGFSPRRLTAAGLGEPLPRTFVDQANSMRFPGFTSTLNVKYVSDLVLNLNF